LWRKADLQRKLELERLPSTQCKLDLEAWLRAEVLEDWLQDPWGSALPSQQREEGRRDLQWRLELERRAIPLKDTPLAEQSAPSPNLNKCTQPEDVKLCTLILRPATAGPQRKKVTLVKESMVHPLEVEPGRFLPQTEQNVPPANVPQPSSHSLQSKISLSIAVGPAPSLPSAVARSALTPRPPTLEDGMRGREGWRERSGGREKWVTTKERVRGRLSQQKERKATQMLAIVLGEEEEAQNN
ncbi:hypothetical protein ATANTOWER_005729, partial [Ataeniobius toweri]|nr:hypothetical protein [Ataeniobius toweri]